MTANNATEAESEQSDENVPIRHIQTVRIGCDERGRIRLQLTEAIRAAGLGGGDAMFRYIPEEAENLGVVPALGMEESITSPRDGRTYSVDSAGGRNRLEIPEDVLTALDIDIDAVKAGNGPLLDVFAGDRMIAFDKSSAIAVSADALPDDYEGDTNEDGEVVLHQAQTTTPMMRSWGVTARLTAGVRQAGNGAEDDLGAIKYLPELSDGLGSGVVPAIVTQYGDGRARDEAYSLSRIAANSGKSSSRGFEATIPDDVLDTLGLSEDDYEDVPLEDRPALTVYAGDHLLAFGRPGEREIAVDRKQTPVESAPTLTDIAGIGPALAEELRERGFETVADLYDAD
ncbi:MAG TPA: helix-hairpin-helix domain-containing protein, partial [Halococcus sp.]|nr:helix-hairpin-helix domain-containing protein [Halococcus sp.]